MLASLDELLSHGLLTLDEATEANSYASLDPASFLRMPPALLLKLWHGLHLLGMDEDEDDPVMH